MQCAARLPFSRGQIGSTGMNRGRRFVALSNAGEVPNPPSSSSGAWLPYLRPFVTSGSQLLMLVDVNGPGTWFSRAGFYPFFINLRRWWIGRDMFLFVLDDIGDCLSTNPCVVHPRFHFSPLFLFCRSRLVMSMMQKAYHWLGWLYR